MLNYICTKDNIRTKSSTCPVCNERTKLEKSDILCNDLTVKIKQLNGSKGGLIKKKNLLEKKITELNIELLKFKNGTYKLIKLPQGRIPKPQPIKIRSSSRLSAIAKQLHESQDE